MLKCFYFLAELIHLENLFVEKHFKRVVDSTWLALRYLPSLLRQALVEVLHGHLFLESQRNVGVLLGG